jgi:gamma-glutamylcyclotransferase (GGCT)/AIG2-like uncharacterized protein YtfP
MRAHEIFNEDDGTAKEKGIFEKYYYFFAYDSFLNEEMVRAIAGANEVLNGSKPMGNKLVKIENAHLEMKSWITIRPKGPGVWGRVWKVSAAGWRKLENAYDTASGGWVVKKVNLHIGTLNPLGEEVNVFQMSPKAYEIRQWAIPSMNFAWPSKYFVGGDGYKEMIRQALRADPQTMKAQYNDMKGYDKKEYPPIQEQEVRMIRLVGNIEEGPNKGKLRAKVIKDKYEKLQNARNPEITTAQSLPPTDLEEGLLNPKKKFLYFGYGANSNKTQFKNRCNSANFVGVAELVGWKLEFRSVANIVRDTSSSVLGAVWQLTEDDLPRLDEYEGAKDTVPAYDRIQTTARLIKGAKGQPLSKPVDIKVAIYEMTAASKQYRKLANPKPSYLQTMYSGYMARYIDTAQINTAMPVKGDGKPKFPRRQEQEGFLRDVIARANGGRTGGDGGKDVIDTDSDGSRGGGDNDD